MDRPPGSEVALRPPAAGTPDEEIESWLAAATERLDPLMAWLGVLFAPLVGYELAATDLSPATSRALTIAAWAMLAGFAFGLAVVAALAGVIGAYLVEERRERAEREERGGVP